MSRFRTSLAKSFGRRVLWAGLVVDLASAPVSAATDTGWLRSAASFAMAGELSSVAATSAGNVWAVGSTGKYPSARSLVVHWDGTTWTWCPARAQRAANCTVSQRPQLRTPGRSALSIAAPVIARP